METMLSIKDNSEENLDEDFLFSILSILYLNEKWFCEKDGYTI